jgi:hypothetical protein
MQPSAVLVTLVLALLPSAQYLVRQTDSPASQLSQWMSELSSPDAARRAFGACSLGTLGERADTAVPALRRLLGDDTKVGEVTCEGEEHGNRRDRERTVGEGAALALARINRSGCSGVAGRSSRFVMASQTKRGLGPWCRRILHGSRAVDRNPERRRMAGASAVGVGPRPSGR